MQKGYDIGKKQLCDPNIRKNNQFYSFGI